MIFFASLTVLSAMRGRISSCSFLSSFIISLVLVALRVPKLLAFLTLSLASASLLIADLMTDFERPVFSAVTAAKES